MLTGFNHLPLAVSSLPRSIAFYEETLGFKLSASWKTGVS
ncbi:VOC family protein [Pseudomonas quasicaspiana]